MIPPGAKIVGFAPTEQQCEALNKLCEEFHPEIIDIMARFAQGCGNARFPVPAVGAASAKWILYYAGKLHLSCSDYGVNLLSDEEMGDIAGDIQQYLASAITARINAKRDAALERN